MALSSSAVLLGYLALAAFVVGAVAIGTASHLGTEPAAGPFISSAGVAVEELGLPSGAMPRAVEDGWGEVSIDEDTCGIPQQPAAEL
jgi:hypothetical protein